ncbi:HK97 gp10 family phage protein [Xenorhabdus sp. DI]|uniref:HK97-gp10 family putative phage morphogenesis protein n=1 Tax=Xenorhabdus doucetiae TaxID=351671 RepID=UPI00199DDE7D|nr:MULTISPECIES: HK97-gp10 family putative phage morphogenesis protein [unclassified Xenorhabdus]MBD2785517.1 HK97 gp10 family phage protein [Xenorhabdus sp. 3]MBD2789871.1 HK97 gp10 family phage protein [Xenorhabdus sp. DI]MBD2797733.1 HK97 gp10 family phage protein [Xenorhabdus sp. 18]
MINTNLDFSGLQDIAADLELLSKAENTQVLRKVTYAAASVLRDEARAKAPKRTGKLARNIMASNRRMQDGTASAGVYVRGSNPKGTNSDTTMKKDDPRNAYYWRFLENGTSKMAPQPFIRPAFDSKADAATEAAIQRANQAIDEILSK